MKRGVLFLLFLVCFYRTGWTQDSLPIVKISGFVDAYYTLNSQGNYRDIPNTYNHSRNNEVNVNLALLQAKHLSKNVRANLGIMGGTYTMLNYAAEPVLLRHIYDANAGVRLLGNWWLDAGIFGSSHVGFESAISKDNWTLTRSLCAENTPYYEAGAELNYEPSEKFLLSLMVLNGWQVIADNNKNKAFGSQITWKPFARWGINTSTYIGEGYNAPDSLVAGMRYFNHFYTYFDFSKKWSVAAIFDMGRQQLVSGKPYYSDWYNPTIMIKHVLSEQWSVCLRGEYYNDPDQVIIKSLSGKAFLTAGASLNVDYHPYSNVWIRSEIKQFQSKNKVFSDGKSGFTSGNLQWTSSLAISF